MADFLTKEARSKRMSLIRSSGNKSTEVHMIGILRWNGIKGWRRHSPLLGKPDFVFAKERLCLFVDGCFWHGCPHCYKPPKSNQKYWREKIRRNRRRDKAVAYKLRKLGYSVARVWECRLQREHIIAAKIKRMLAVAP